VELGQKVSRKYVRLASASLLDGWTGGLVRIMAVRNEELASICDVDRPHSVTPRCGHKLAVSEGIDGARQVPFLGGDRSYSVCDAAKHSQLPLIEFALRGHASVSIADSVLRYLGHGVDL
jgi:hypothetical protein